MSLSIPNLLASKKTGNGQEFHFLIEGPAGRLEALLSLPDAWESKEFAAIVCHPHPLHEGSMHNKVVHTCTRALYLLDIPVLRFNFRGVGKSEGNYAETIGEKADLIAVYVRLRSIFPFRQMILAGFSFGAHIALKSWQELDAKSLITIAPPVHSMQLDEIIPPSRNWLLIQGLADEVVSSEAVLSWAQALQNPPDIKTFDNVGHFFHGHLPQLRETIRHYLVTVISL